MSTNYIHIGTLNNTNNDHHRELTIQVNSATNAADIVRNFMAEDVEPVQENQTPDIPLFKYIHPSVTTENEKRQIHREVENLVRHFPLPDICRHLRQMRSQNRVYINIKPELMFEELHRLGMPDESTPGFTKKNFMNYFNIND